MIERAPLGPSVPDRDHVSAETLDATPRDYFDGVHRARRIDEETGASLWDGRAPDYEACVGAILRAHAA